MRIPFLFTVLLYYYIKCVTGLRWIHELTARKGQTNLVRLDFESANFTKGFDSFNDFLVDAAPGYRAHIGTRNSSLNLGMYREHMGARNSSLNLGMHLAHIGSRYSSLNPGIIGHT